MGVIGTVKNMSFAMGVREGGEKNGFQTTPIKTSSVIFFEKGEDR